MNKIKKLIALTSMMALCASQIHGQENCAPPMYSEQSDALNDSEEASYLSALLPIGALVAAAVIIATTNRHHHHHHSSSGGGSSSTKFSSSSRGSSSSSYHHSHNSSGHF
jgi:hypothetical protein